MIGPLFWAAAALQFAANFAEQSGRLPKDSPKPPAVLRLLYAIAAFAPALLLVHAYMATRASPEDMPIAIGAVVLAVLLGMALGAVIRIRALAPLAGPIALIAFALALYVSWPSLAALYADVRTGRAVLRAP